MLSVPLSCCFIQGDKAKFEVTEELAAVEQVKTRMFSKWNYTL